MSCQGAQDSTSNPTPTNFNSKRVMLRKDSFEICYILQYSTRNAKGVLAQKQVMDIFEIFHSIITSFDCLIGLEPMYGLL
jgi:hypothetical protein